MDLEEFAIEGYNMVDYIAHYIDSISLRRVLPNASPGYLHSALPSTAPTTGVKLNKILQDIESHIMPGLLQSQHPGYHAFLPSCSSFPATIGAMLADIFSHVGFDWKLSPSRCELERIAVDWYGKMIGLPGCFLQGTEGSRGAGMTLRSTSECIFIAMITARRRILRKLLNRNPSLSTSVLISSLVVYCSEESRNSIEKITVVALVNVRVLRTRENHSLTSQIVEKAMEEDEEVGLIPFFAYITMGSVWCGSSDPINKIGVVCKRHGVWLHVNASYAGNAMVCPELRHYIKGIEYASSFNSNPDCWMPVNVDCAVMFVKDRHIMKEAMILDRTEYGYSFFEKDWGYPCKTEFKPLVLWVVMKSYGIEGIQEIIRKHIRLAEMLADYIRSDDRFEFISRNFGITCFQLVGSDDMNKRLKMEINATGKVFVTPCPFANKYVIQFHVCKERASVDDINDAWKVICEQADKVLNDACEEPSESAFDIFEDYYKFTFI